MWINARNFAVWPVFWGKYSSVVSAFRRSPGVRRQAAFAPGAGPYHPMTLLDEHSRYALTHTFRRYGLPLRILAGNWRRGQPQARGAIRRSAYG